MGSKIIRLVASNVKRLTAVDITPDPGASTVIVGGRNAQGKTSCLDAIAMALGGGAQIPGKPVRRGASKARIELDLGDLQVVRTFTASGGSQLEVRGKDGAKLKSPQAVLDRLCSRIAFDPLEYSRMKATDQADVLRELVGLDTAQLDADRKSVFDRRTDAKREAAALKSRLDQMPSAEAPAEEVSVSALVAELQNRADQLTGKTVLETSVRQTADAEGRANAEFVRARAALQRAEDDCNVAHAAHAAALEKLSEYPEPLPIDEVKQQLAGAEVTNRSVRSAKERAKVSEDLRRAAKIVANFSAELDQYDEAKRAATAAVEFPIPGLSFGEDGGVLLNGLPLDQASSAEQLRCSVAMGLALHPELKVLLVRDGSLLDGESLAMVAELAAEAGGQVWVERVSEDGAGCSVVIEDGHVAGAEAPAESGPGVDESTEKAS